jgi:nucleoside-diphosphate-sugar epimerase
LRVFVTGGTGFIGIHLCRRLVERGDEVVVLVRSKTKAARLPKGARVFEGDLSMFADPSCVLPECDVVVHLAGVVAADSLDEYDAVNRRAVGALVDCVARQSWKPRRFLFASSLAAAGPSAPSRPWTEADPPAPIEEYGRAKAEAEPLVAAAPFPTTSFRPPLVFGPGDEASLTLFKSARAGIGFRVAGKPQELSFVDVRDLVDAIVLMADDPRPGHFVYFAGHPRTIDVRELWTELARAVGRRVLVVPVLRPLLFGAMLVATGFSKIFRFKNQLDKKQYSQMVAPAFVCSSDRLRSELDFQPKYDLAETLSNAAQGYREAGWL